MERLEDLAVSQPDRVKIHKKARVTKLIKDSAGAVVGVEYEFKGKAEKAYGPVVLATGGYAADFTKDSLLKKYRPEYYELPTTNGDHCTGDGHKMALAAGANAVDETGLKDTVEFINVSKDDALAYPRAVHRTYPAAVNARMEGTIRPFVAKSLEVNNTVLEVFNEKLGLPAGELGRRHTLSDTSCSEARCIKNPPAPQMSPERAALGAHTDFGSLVRVFPPMIRTHCSL